MHQTTVRFGSDLWSMLEAEAERIGVSAAQYIREAALARLAYSEGWDAASAERGAFGWVAPLSESLDARVRNELESARAVSAQGEHVRLRARELRDKALEARTRTSRLTHRTPG
jgi:hypothetical protein